MVILSLKYKITISGINFPKSPFYYYCKFRTFTIRVGLSGGLSSVSAKQKETLILI